MKHFNLATKGDSEGFVSSPLEGRGAGHKDSYFPISDESTAELRDTGAKQTFYRLHATDVEEIFQGVNPQGALHQLDVNHNGDQQITFYSTDVEMWFNQIETQFEIHQITDDDERYRSIVQEH